MRKLLVLLLAAGCFEPSDSLDAGMTPPPDAGSKTVVFEAEALAGPALAFGQATLTDDRLAVDLIAQELSRVYGLAYRITFDPEVLAFERFDRSTAFIHDDLFEVREAAPGLLVVAMSAVGPFRGIDLDGVAIARISFARTSDALTELRITRPFGLDEEGREIGLSAGSGAIVER